MKMMSYTVVATAIFLSILYGNAEAAFRCPNGNLVDVGDSISTVTLKCDPPASVSKSLLPVETEKGQIFYIEIQLWVYTAGSTLIHTLKFNNGVLTDISTGGFVP